MASLYGIGLYGKGLYSQSSTWNLAGGLTPSVAFAGNFDVVGKAYFVGNLAPVIRFAANLAVDRAFAGSFAPIVAFAGDMTSGPLWTDSAPCAPVDWEEAELCHG